MINDRPRVVTPVCDKARHLVCEPYTLPILHEVAAWLGIKRHWFHKNHYDIPKQMIEQVTAKCKVVTTREIVELIKGSL